MDWRALRPKSEQSDLSARPASLRVICVLSNSKGEHINGRALGPKGEQLDLSARPASFRVICVLSCIVLTPKSEVGCRHWEEVCGLQPPSE